MVKRKYIKISTIREFLKFVDPQSKIVIHDPFEWETYEFSNSASVANDFLDCWVYDVDIRHLGEVRFVINDGFTDEDGNAYIVDIDKDGKTFVEMN